MPFNILRYMLTSVAFYKQIDLSNYLISSGFLTIQSQRSEMSREIKRRLLKAKFTLQQTIQSILTINRKRKALDFLETEQVVEKSGELQEELKVLNKIAAHQARLVQHYEMELATVPNYRR